MFAEYAEIFHDLGYNVLPCQGKRPVVEWAEWQNHVQAKEIVQGWSSAYPFYNIGVVCNHGLIAIDVDTETEADTKKAREICEFALGRTPMEKIGRRGFTLFYRANFVLSKKEPGLPIDFPKQTILPPSLHPDTGQPYVWAKGCRPTALKELPEIKEENIQELFKAFKRAGIIRTLVRDGTVVNDQPINEKLEPGNRNAYLSRMAYHLRVNFKQQDLTDEKCINILLAEDSAHLSAANSYFGDPKDFNGCSDRRRNAETFWNKQKAAMMKKGDPVLHKNYEIVETAQTEVIEELGENLRLEERARAEHDEFIIGQRKKLLDLIPRGGLIEDLYSYIHKLYPGPSPTLPFTGALGILATLGCNTYQLRRNWPNLYILAVAYSGAGKSFPQKGAKQIFQACGNGMSRFIGFGKYASPEGILADIVSRPKRTRLDIYDEFGSFMQKIEHDQRFSPAKQILLTTWSESSGSVLGRTKAAETDLPICNPCLNLVAYTTPTDFKQYVTSRFVGDGFGARFLYFIDDRTGFDSANEMSNEDVQIPVELIERMREIFKLPVNEVQITDPASYQRMLFDGKKNKEHIEALIHAANVKIEPHKLSLNMAGMELLTEINTATWKRTGELNRSLEVMQEHYLVPILQRKVEVICKLAIVWAMSQGRVDVVGAEAIEWGQKVFEYSMNNVEFHLGGLLTQTDPEAVLHGIKKWVLNRTENFVRKSDLRKHCARFLRGKSHRDLNIELEAIIKSLMEDGVIELDNRPRINRNIQYKIVRT